MKRIIDILLGVGILIILLLPILLIALLVRFTSNGKTLYWSDRVGKNGVLFRMPKFRSMQVDTPTVASHLMTNPNAFLSPIGVFLRRFSLDELPQLFSILKGDMSFVGPRPDVPGYADKLQGEDRNILKLRPGITSVASLKYANEELLLSKVKDPVDYNNNVIYPDKVKMNLNYYYNHNIWIDIKVIFATIFLLKKSIFIKND